MSFLNNTTGHLFSELLKELRILVSKEFELAKAEVSNKLDTSIRNSVTVAVGGVVAYAGFLVLLAAAVYGLGRVLPMWLSALLIGSFLMLAGSILALASISRLKKMKIQPEHTMSGVRDDRDWAKREIREART